MTVIIDAIKMCEESETKLKENVKTIKGFIGEKPNFVIINASDDPGNARYIENKVTDGEKIGLNVIVEKLDENCTNQDVENIINTCNTLNVPVILQEPTYDHLNSKLLASKINYNVDADGFSKGRIGDLSLGQEAVYPATPKGVMNLLDFHNVDVSGKVALVIGRSNHVGKPMAVALINRGATVLVANSKTKDLDSLVRQADIIISCAGKLDLIKAKDVKQGSILIGVGFTYIGRKQLLDFDIEEIVNDGKATLVSNRINCTGKATINALLENVVSLYNYNIVNGCYGY